MRLAALLHDVGKPKTRSIGPSGVSFHHHEVVGARMARERMIALRYPQDLTDDVVRLVELHLRIHTYAMGWTDRAVRRYARDAGPLLDELNHLVRCDCTTRNRKKAAALGAADGRARGTDPGPRRAGGARLDPPAARRPRGDGDPRPPARAATSAGRSSYLLELRLDEGPISREDGGLPPPRRVGRARRASPAT